MATRTDATKVGLVIGLASGADLTGIISAANIITDRVSSMASEAGITLNTNELEQIETYLAAHLYALKDPQYIAKTTEGASATFQGQTGMALDSTFWGQTAKMLDFSGSLAKLDKGIIPAEVMWIGTKQEDVT